jgi:P-type Cu+ transporter
MVKIASGEDLVSVEVKCYHCGQPCDDHSKKILFSDKPFCCLGCKTVFEILNENNLCEYYDFDSKPGVPLRYVKEDSFAYLDEPAIKTRLLEFQSSTFCKVNFYIPNIHCISCIWLLENLNRLNGGVLKSQINFSSKTIKIDFNSDSISLRDLAKLLASVGYGPQIQLENEKSDPQINPSKKTLILKLAIAGFCFGNVMLLSFPEYFGIDGDSETLKRLFSWLNILLAVPAVVYSGRDYFTAAWQSYRQRQINIDVPIAVGLLALFLRSVYDIISSTGPGYLDSLTGLIFFLLIGRWFQSKTYESFAFDRDYRSYFPLAVQRKKNDAWQSVIVYELEPDDCIRLRNMEIIPADSILLEGTAFLDYSFVTGESRPVKAKKGDLLYAGGRLIGEPVTLTVKKKTSQSYLTSLWNNDAFSKPEEKKYKKIIDRAARRFTWIVLVIAIVAGTYWYIVDPSRVWLIITSILMVACPCALALATPFTYGNMLRVFGRHGLYLKNADVIEQMAIINAVVFDKTGTITHGTNPNIKFHGELSKTELSWIKLLTSYSTHPLSNLITKNINAKPHTVASDFKEIPGKGIEAIIEENTIQIGSAEFTGASLKMNDFTTKVFISINGESKGYFSIQTSLRGNIKSMLGRLGNQCVALLSGDNDTDRTRMKGLFHQSVQLLFNQSPHDKLHFVNNLQRAHKKVMMLGDGLNDSGALKQSDVGIAVTDDTGIFTPACDGILHGDKIGSLDKFLSLAQASTVILKAGFIISFMYNAIALSFAVSGHLTPLVAAILMPISSISVVGFTSIAVNYVASLKKL